MSRPASVPRDDAPAKSSGSARYLADLPIPDALSVGLLLSERPHARLRAVTLPPLPDGYARVDYRDVPGANAVHMINDSWPLFPEDTVSYVDQPILLIVGPDPAVVADLLGRTEVEYEELPAIIGFDAAEAAAALSAPGAVFVEYRLRGAPGPATGHPAAPGRFAAASAAGAPTLSETFETGAQEHAYLEPQAVAAWVDGGRVVVHGSMQCPYYVKRALETILGLPTDRVRVVQSTTGGAFGGKEEYPSVLAGYVAVAAWKTGRPVRLVLDRSVDMRISTKRHPSRITLASSVDPDGRLVSTAVDLRTDGGAFEGLSATVLQRAIFAASGVYRIPDAEVRGRSYRTNLVPSGAFRGFGSPQAFFAIEMHLTHLARERGEDPADVKRRHLLRQGDRTITGGTLRDPVLLPEMLDDVLARSDYRRKRPEYEQPGREARRSAEHRPTAGAARGLPPTVRGIGLSLFSHGCGFTGSGERDIIKARVKLQRHADGRVEILCSNVEMGQGAETTLRRIVADAMEIGMERVTFAVPDTDRVPDSGPTVASRTAMVVGGLLYRAAKRLASGGSVVEEVYRQPGEIEWDQATFTGDAYPAFSWGANVVEVEVDTLTYDVTPIAVWAAYDIGQAIDERIVTGQIHGGIVQGLGYATSEHLDIAGGAYRQHTMTDYVIPGPLDTPAIDVRLFSNPYHGGPFGAKGAGEIPFTGAAPALADAVECALGIQVYRIPLTPEYLEEACL